MVNDGIVRQAGSVRDGHSDEAMLDQVWSGMAGVVSTGAAWLCLVELGSRGKDRHGTSGRGIAGGEGIGVASSGPNRFGEAGEAKHGPVG